MAIANTFSPFPHVTLREVANYRRMSECYILKTGSLFVAYSHAFTPKSIYGNPHLNGEKDTGRLIEDYRKRAKQRSTYRHTTCFHLHYMIACSNQI